MSVDNIAMLNLDTFEIVGNLSPKKAALVNLSTNIVENIIMVNTFEDPVPENYKLVEITLNEIPITEEERQLYEIIKEIDPSYPNNIPKLEVPINIGATKWSVERGFYEE